ncbi:MAG: dynamin family protein [Planctomycetota bacterium]
MAQDAEALLAKYDDLNRISSDLSELGRAIETTRAYRAPFNWEQFRQQLDQQAEQIRERRFRLAFAGGFSVGKSYLVNAFLGKRGLLPSYNRPTTGVVCALRRGRRSVMQVTYWTRTESDEMQRFYMNEIGIPRSVPVAEGRQAAQDLRNSLPPEKRRVIDDYENFCRAHERFASKLGQSEDVDVKEVALEHRHDPSVKDYPHLNYIIKVDETQGEPNQDLLRTIKQVVLYVDSPYLTESVEIVDLPGAGATDPIDGFIQRYFLQRTDGVVVTTTAQAPFGEEEGAVVDILKDNHDSLKGRVFVCVTMFDRLGFGTERQPERLDSEYRSLRLKLKNMGLGDAPFFYMASTFALLAEREKRGEKLSDDELRDLERERAWNVESTKNAELDQLLRFYLEDGGMPEVRRVLLDQFRSSMIRLKIHGIAKALGHLSSQLGGSYRKRWENAAGEQSKQGARRIAHAIRFLNTSADNFVKRSQRFRRENVQKQNFEDTFETVLTRVGERIDAYMELCTEESLRHLHDGLGGGREPVELLSRYREAVERDILNDFYELVWDRMPRPTFDRADDDDFGLEVEPEARSVPELSPESRGLLRRHIRDKYYEAIEFSELTGLIQGLLPHNQDEQQIFQRVFGELDLALEITTRNFLMRETLELSDSREIDDLAKGCVQYPDWAKRYARDYASALKVRLKKYCLSLRTYLWNLYYLHLEEAEARLHEFLASDELMGLVTVNLDDISLPSQTGRFGSPAKLLQHFEAWKAIDAAITTLDREVAN